MRGRAKVEAPDRVASGVAAAGCADASLYRRFHRAGLRRPGARYIHFSATGPRIVRRVSAAWRRRVTTGQGTRYSWQKRDRN